MEFKDKVKAARAKLLLTQEQLAKALGCTMTTVNRWENGKIPPSFILEAAFNNFCADKGIKFDDRNKEEQKNYGNDTSRD